MSSVSIIIPVYNAGRYLEEAVHSVLNQTFTDWELILVDDGSTDSSPGICDAFSETDSRIHVIHQENRGCNAAVHTGVMHVSSEWTMFLDSDDIYKPEMIRTLYDAAVTTGADCARCGYEKFGSNNRPERPLIMIDRFFSRSEIQKEILIPFYEEDGNIYRNWSAPRWDKIYRTGKLKIVFSFIDSLTTIGEDVEMNMHFLELADSVVNVNAYLYCYRVLDKSLAHGYTPKMELEYNKFWLAMDKAALAWNHPFEAENCLQDNGIVNMMAELLPARKPLKEKIVIYRHLYSLLSNKKAALKLLAHMDIPMKQQLLGIYHRIRKGREDG